MVRRNNDTQIRLSIILPFILCLRVFGVVLDPDIRVLPAPPPEKTTNPSNDSQTTPLPKKLFEFNGQSTRVNAYQSTNAKISNPIQIKDITNTRGVSPYVYWTKPPNDRHSTRSFNRDQEIISFIPCNVFSANENLPVTEVFPNSKSSFKEEIISTLKTANPITYLPEENVTGPRENSLMSSPSGTREMKTFLPSKDGDSKKNSGSRLSLNTSQKCILSNTKPMPVSYAPIISADSKQLSKTSEIMKENVTTRENNLPPNHSTNIIQKWDNGKTLVPLSATLYPKESISKTSETLINAQILLTTEAYQYSKPEQLSIDLEKFCPFLICAQNYYSSQRNVVNNKLSVRESSALKTSEKTLRSEVNSNQEIEKEGNQTVGILTTNLGPLDILVARDENEESDRKNKYSLTTTLITLMQGISEIQSVTSEVPTAIYNNTISYGTTEITNIRNTAYNQIERPDILHLSNNKTVDNLTKTTSSLLNSSLSQFRTHTSYSVKNHDGTTPYVITPNIKANKLIPTQEHPDAISYLKTWQAKIKEFIKNPPYPPPHNNNIIENNERIFWFWKPTTPAYTTQYTTTSTLKPTTTQDDYFESTQEETLFTLQLPDATNTPTVAKPDFEVYWNVPTFQCHKHGLNFSSVSQWGLEQNFLDEFRGESIAILYDPGEFPALLSGPGEHRVSRNGGVPQEASLTRHLDLFQGHLEKLIPDRQFSGLGVIDFEHWRPVWRQNWGSLAVYRDYSRHVERRRHPFWFSSMIEKEAKFKYELAARTFILETLRLAKELRPMAKWGYYGYPFCFNYTPNNNRATCSVETSRENDGMSWLFKEVTAHYPSLYLKEKGMYGKRRQFVEGRLSESMRVAQEVPVYPYIWYKYHDTNRFLSEKDMREVLRRPMLRGCRGVVIWGASRDVNTRQKCLELQKYLEEVIGPLVLELHSGLRLDSDDETTPNTEAEYSNEEEDEEDDEEKDNQEGNDLRKIVRLLKV